MGALSFYYIRWVDTFEYLDKKSEVVWLTYGWLIKFTHERLVCMWVGLWQFPIEGRRFPLGTPVSSCSKNWIGIDLENKSLIGLAQGEQLVAYGYL